MPIVEAVEHLGGLQAQTPHSWYLGLGARLSGITPLDVSALLEDRSLVRVALHRSTIHLVSARDCLAWRPLIQPVIVRSTATIYARRLAGADVAELTDVGRAALEEQPLTFAALEKILAERWPEADPHALSATVRAQLPLIQVPPRGTWGPAGPVSGPIAHTTAAAWLGDPPAPAGPEELIRRYLGAFGPAGVKDAQTWTGLTRLREVFDRLRPSLVTFTDDDGRELFDLPDAPRPGADTPAPVRLLYDFDNVHLSYAERTRFGTVPKLGGKNGVLPGTILVDGVVQGIWTLTRSRSGATLTVRPVTKWARGDASAIEAEATTMLKWAADGGTYEVGEPL
ncbi:winged helix DNA-binding domain-containing protein [Cryptosporangium phraense]|uniref:Winged helix DNA-binding domain-containing protein n=1 Tax=Cryptosporangium phraense TaxID=2593070 RepID=A0A545AFN8_9ACTN|nr:winged helix DNA-binding domain-containing protein [Cryptosporangium phraense]TQS40152.1 winged helix DNA-binding domain-containing protein [Cryptosporangium phraense]